MVTCKCQICRKKFIDKFYDIIIKTEKRTIPRIYCDSCLDKIKVKPEVDRKLVNKFKRSLEDIKHGRIRRVA